MPRYRKPSNNEQRRSALQMAAAVGMREAAEGTSKLSDEMISRAADMVHRMESLEDTLAEQKLARAQAVDRADAALLQMRSEVRSAWRWMRKYVGWDMVPSSYYASFGITQQGVFPKGSGRAFWLQQAAQVLKGMNRLMSAGYHLQHLRPDALQALYTDAQGAVVDVKHYKGRVQDTEAEQRLLRKEADATKPQKRDGANAIPLLRF